MGEDNPQGDGTTGHQTKVAVTLLALFGPDPEEDGKMLRRYWATAVAPASP
jgi:hypothetical protein